MSDKCEIVAQKKFNSNYYELLGLEADCTEQQIKQAYRQLARKFHPDKNDTDSLAEEKFKAISQAYTTLSDATERRLYNARLETERIQRENEEARKRQQQSTAKKENNVTKQQNNCTADGVGKSNLKSNRTSYEKTSQSRWSQKFGRHHSTTSASWSSKSPSPPPDRPTSKGGKKAPKSSSTSSSSSSSSSSKKKQSPSFMFDCTFSDSDSDEELWREILRSFASNLAGFSPFDTDETNQRKMQGASKYRRSKSLADASFLAQQAQARKADPESFDFDPNEPDSNELVRCTMCCTLVKRSNILQHQGICQQMPSTHKPAASTFGRQQSRRFSSFEPQSTQTQSKSYYNWREASNDLRNTVRRQRHAFTLSEENKFEEFESGLNRTTGSSFKTRGPKQRLKCIACQRPVTDIKPENASGSEVYCFLCRRNMFAK